MLCWSGRVVPLRSICLPLFCTQHARVGVSEGVEDCLVSRQQVARENQQNHRCNWLLLYWVNSTDIISLRAVPVKSNRGDQFSTCTDDFIPKIPVEISMIFLFGYLGSVFENDVFKRPVCWSWYLNKISIETSTSGCRCIYRKEMINIPLPSFHGDQYLTPELLT